MSCVGQSTLQVQAQPLSLPFVFFNSFLFKTTPKFCNLFFIKFNMYVILRQIKGITKLSVRNYTNIQNKMDICKNNFICKKKIF